MSQSSLFDPPPACTVEEAIQVLKAAGYTITPPRVPTRPVDAPRVSVGRRHPTTSITAALNALPRSGTQRRRAYDMIRASGENGATSDEVERTTGLSHQTISARINELMNDGWIFDSGKRRRTRNGQKAIVWRARVE